MRLAGRITEHSIFISPSECLLVEVRGPSGLYAVFAVVLDEEARASTWQQIWRQRLDREILMLEHRGSVANAALVFSTAPQGRSHRGGCDAGPQQDQEAQDGDAAGPAPAA